MSNREKLVIFDTTLRDGEQSPGATMSVTDKIELALLLEALGVDVIEAGFAMASPADFDAVKKIAAQIKSSRVCSLSRARVQDIEAAAQALSAAERFRIHTFIATSDVHMKYKLKMSPDEVIAATVKAVQCARNFTDDVEFSCEDAGRSRSDFLVRVIEAAIDAGATTINLPDTVGYSMPHQFGQLIAEIRQRVINADKAIFSVHCHNDLGMATANSLAAIEQGARQVECTINGLGERAGNAALEEVVMAVNTRQDVFPVYTDVKTEHLVHLSQKVSEITQFAVQPNKAIVGRNAFAHEAGIHQDGVIKHRETYEIMRAEDVGWNGEQMVLGKHSGRHAFRSRLDQLGIAFASDEELNCAFNRFKERADSGAGLSDNELKQLVL